MTFRNEWVVEILTPEPIGQEGLVRRLLEAIGSAAPCGFPVRWGWREPAHRPWTGASFEEIGAAPPDKFALFWTGEKRNRGYAFSVTASSMHSVLWLQFTARAIDDAAAVALIRTLASECVVDFGFVHRMSSHETARARALHTFAGSLFVTSHDLARGIPDLYWLTVLGPPFVRLLGDQPHASAPG